MKYSITIASDHPAELQAFLSTLQGIHVAGNNVAITGTDADEDNGPPAVIAEGAVDSTGLPWDARIHSSSKKINADGKWKKARNIDDSTVTAVEGELRGRLAAIASAQTAPGVVPPPAAVPATVTPPPPPATPPAPPVAAPAPVQPPHDAIAAAVADGWVAHPTSAGYYYKGQEVLTTEATAAKYPAPAAAAAVTAPPAPAAPAGAVGTTFHDVMQAISTAVAANKIDTDGVYVGQLAAALGVGQITEIAASPDKIAQAFAKMQADGKL